MRIRTRKVDNYMEVSIEAPNNQLTWIGLLNDDERRELARHLEEVADDLTSGIVLDDV